MANMNGMSNMSGMDMSKSGQTNTTTMPMGNTSSDMTSKSMGAMGNGLNFQTSGFAILFESWYINNTGQFIGSLVLLFFVSLFADLMGRYKFKSYGYDKYVYSFKSMVRGFIGALLMLAMMTFNFYVILFIVLGTGAAHLLLPMNQNDDEPYLCH